VAKASAVRDPRSYTPKHLAEKILTTRSALEGERKQVTVLFADVKGSVELSAQLGAEEWHGIMDRFFRILADGVHRFEGTVNQYTGDGIMALFGAPIAHEDHAQRACYAALHLKDELRRYQEDVKRRHAVTFSVRMGINSGEVVVGRIGDDLRMDYTAQGETVGLAHRLQELADPGTAYLSERTAALVSGFFTLHDIGLFEVKGIGKPPRVYELQGPGRLRTRLEVSRSRGFSRFVGREAEMHILETALERAIGGQGQVIGVVGEPGVGKSRLCLEFMERCRGRGLRTNEGHCPPHGKVLPFVPILELLRSYFGIVEHDSPEEARRKIAGTLLLLGEEFREVLPIIFEFLGVGDPERPAPLVDGDARQRALFGFLRRLTQAGAEREPFVVLIDDLHWIDPASDAFVGQFVEAVEGQRVLFVANFRPEYHGAWLRKSYYQQLPLLPLGSEATEALLDDLLGRDGALAPLRAKILDRTRGNPFFVEEVVQALLESGALEGAKGALRLAHTVESLEIPGTVQAVLASRIDRLAEREKRLLGVASVVGMVVPAEILQRVAGLSDADLSASLAKLSEAELLYEAAIYPRAEYAFKHPLTREVAYHSQLVERRHRIHVEVARALEEVEADRLDESAAALAHHYEEAGQRLGAGRWHGRAAEWTEKTDLGQALEHWRKVRRFMSDVSESPEVVALGLLACRKILSIGWHLGLSEDEAPSVFATGRPLAERARDLRSLAILLATYGSLRSSAGACDDFVDKSLEAMRVARQTIDLDLQAVIATFVQIAHLFAGRVREGLAFSESVLRDGLANRVTGSDVAVYNANVCIACLRGIFLLMTGATREALLEIDRAERLAVEHDDRIYRCIVNTIRSWCADITGSDVSVLARGRRGLEIAESVGYRYGIYYALEAIGFGHVLRGEWTDARRALESAVAFAREHRIAGPTAPRSLTHLARVELRLGEIERARSTIEAAVRAGREHHARLLEIQAHLERARILREIDGSDGIEEASLSLGAAERLIEETGAESFRPQVLEERGRLADLCGDTTARDRELAEAHRLYVAIGADGHAARLAKEMAAP
jgi:class 3 adenylate cyclase/tetratricopeptide (TPR) repeat protein